MTYYVIHNSGGDTLVTTLTEDELKKRLAEQYWGPVGFLSYFDENDTNYWGENILIIKGDIVVPKAVQTITEYKV